jgi:general secretion pathway protein G
MENPLMKQIVLRLIIVLLTFAIGIACANSYRSATSYRINLLQSQESVLRSDLFQMRKMIDQYAADRGQLPQSLDDLVNAGYLREIPTDPITKHKDWMIVMGEDPYSSESIQGVVDVHSASSAKSSEGRPYKEW